MVQAITVAPSADGWTVESEAFDSEMFFPVGRRRRGRRLQARNPHRAGGRAGGIRIFLRDGALGGRYVCAPHSDDYTRS